MPSTNKFIHKRHVFDKYSPHEIYGERGGAECTAEEAEEGGPCTAAEEQALHLILDVANFFAAHVEAPIFLLSC